MVLVRRGGHWVCLSSWHSDTTERAVRQQNIKTNFLPPSSPVLSGRERLTAQPGSSPASPAVSRPEASPAPLRALALHSPQTGHAVLSAPLSVKDPVGRRTTESSLVWRQTVPGLPRALAIKDPTSWDTANPFMIFLVVICLVILIWQPPAHYHQGIWIN